MAVRNKLQTPLSHNSRIKLLKCACSGISWISKRFFCSRTAILVNPIELDCWHENFAAHFQHIRNRNDLSPRQFERDCTNSFDILCDVIALTTIPPCCTQDKLPLLIAKTDGNTIDFWFDDIANFGGL